MHVQESQPRSRSTEDGRPPIGRLQDASELVRRGNRRAVSGPVVDAVIDSISEVLPGDLSGYFSNEWELFLDQLAQLLLRRIVQIEASWIPHAVGRLYPGADLLEGKLLVDHGG